MTEEGRQYMGTGREATSGGLPEKTGCVSPGKKKNDRVSQKGIVKEKIGMKKMILPS